MVLRARPGRLVVLTGAGISTESGIPDYRSPGRPPHRPIQNFEFMTSSSTRARFWARSFVGWEAFSSAAPGRAHRALAAMARPVTDGGLGGISLITQNVDRLHAAAGSADVIELHGNVHEVACLDCGTPCDRATLQTRMAARNAAWAAHFAPRARAPDPGDGAAPQRPDGDMMLPLHAHESFAVPTCEACSGNRLKPRVVFFGGTIEPSVRAAARTAVDAADALLVIGTTLSVWSALSLVRAAASRGTPVAIINQGATRADDIATVKLHSGIGDTLTALAAAIERTRNESDAAVVADRSRSADAKSPVEPMFAA